MMKAIVNSIRMVLVLTVLTGIAYPLAMTGLAQSLFPAQANGSLISQDGKIIGSNLIGQKFSSPAYFHSRPSAAGSEGYDATASAGSNLGPTNEMLKQSVSDRLADVRKENNLSVNKLIPGDLVLASASGLDPHISPEAAYLQIERIANERKMKDTEIRTLVDQYTEGRQFGIFGEPRVNVLELNLAIDNTK